MMGGVFMKFPFCQDQVCCLFPPHPYPLPISASAEPAATGTCSQFLESQNSGKSGKAALKCIWSINEDSFFFFPNKCLWLAESHSCFVNQRSVF